MAWKAFASEREPLRSLPDYAAAMAEVTRLRALVAEREDIIRDRECTIRSLQGRLSQAQQRNTHLVQAIHGAVSHFKEQP